MKDMHKGKRLLAYLLGIIIIFALSVGLKAEVAWSQLHPSGPLPSVRMGHTMAYDELRHVIVLFGGYSETGGLKYDTWVWDGTNWIPKTSVLHPSPRTGHAMAYDRGRGQIVLFGGFDGITRLNDTWLWDGEKWTPVPAAPGDPLKREFARMVYDPLRAEIVLFGGLAGGSSAQDSDETWVWDGTRWTQKLPASSPIARWLHSMAFDEVHGEIVLFGGLHRTERLNDTWVWDGDNWTNKYPIYSPTKRVQTAMAYDAANKDIVLFGGTGDNVPPYETYSWDGDNWNNESRHPLGRYGHAMVFDEVRGEIVLFGGAYGGSPGDTTFLNDTWAWSGSKVILPGWDSLIGDPGIEGAVQALALKGTSLYAGGSFAKAGGKPANNIAMWDGTSWSALTAGIDGPVRVLLAVGDKLYVGGSFSKAGNTPVSNLAVWDGASWSGLGGGTNGPVNALAASGTKLYVGGNFGYAADVFASNIAVWDEASSSWSALMGGTAGEVNALAVKDNILYLGGYFTHVQGTAIPANRVARWDGNNWSAMGSGFSTVVRSLAVYGNMIFAGSEFYQDPLARWDGNSWASSGLFMGSVLALAVDGSVLYAAGDFDYAGGVIANGVAKWDGSRWTSFCAGMEGSVLALAADNDLYAGGVFTTAGGRLSNMVALWHESTVDPIIIVDSPRFGNAWSRGSTQNIEWTCAGVSCDVLIELYKGGAPYPNLAYNPIGKAYASAGQYSWDVPVDIEPGNNYQIVITEGATSATSGLFSIYEGVVPSINITAPVADDSWLRGSTKKISWTSTGVDGNLELELYKDNVKIKDIGAVPENYREYLWYLEETLELGEGYSIRAYQGAVVGNSETFSIVLPNYHIEYTTVDFANISPSADLFSIWIDFKVNGNRPPKESYKFRIVKDDLNTRLADQIEISDPIPYNYVDKNGANIESSRFRVVFRIQKDQKNIPYFENGLLQVFSEGPESVNYTIPAEKLQLRAYGSNFNMSHDAYPFNNGVWDYIRHSDFNEYFRAGDTVSAFLDPIDKAFFWEAVGFRTILDINNVYLFKSFTPDGLCYGMANSSIANFTHSDNGTDAWGNEGINGWIDEFHNSWWDDINNRWPTWANAPQSLSNKPYPFNERDQNIFSNTQQDGNWTLEAAKRIMYYHAAQESYSSSGWPGEDISESPVRLSTLKSLLIKGNPISLGLGIHQVTVVQLIEFDIKRTELGPQEKSCRISYYDNNRTYYDQDVYSPFFLFKFDNLSNDVLDFENKTFQVWLKDLSDKITEPAVIKKADIISLEGDSQKIYGDVNTYSVATILGPDPGSEKSSLSGLESGSMSFAIPNGYSKLSLIGAQRFMLFDGSGTLLEAVKNAMLDGTKAVYFHAPDSILTIVFLPNSGASNYRIEVEKDPRISRLKIFYSIPMPNGTNKLVGYNNIHVSEEGSTQAEFYFGQGNSDYRLKRTSDDGAVDIIMPSFNADVAVPVGEISCFNAVKSGLNVILTWQNPEHPKFSNVMIVRKEDAPPTNDMDGVIVYSGTGNSVADTLPLSGVYYYGGFSYGDSDIAEGPIVIRIDTSLHTISGKVSLNTQGIESALLSLSGYGVGNLGTFTSQNGQYSFKNLSDGKYILTCSANGYVFTDASRVITIAGGSVVENFQASVSNSLKVTSPNGQELWLTGSSQFISWVTTGSVGNVKIELSTDEGTSFSTIVDSTPNDGCFIWPVEGTISSNCIVRVSSGGITDSSDAAFSIVSPQAALQVLSPNGGERIQSGSKQKIRWKSALMDGNIRLELIHNDSLAAIIGEYSHKQGSVIWETPKNLPAGGGYRVRASQGYSSDYSDNAFEIFIQKDDLVVTRDSDGVYYRNSDTVIETKLANPADLLACGDLDRDGIDDLVRVGRLPDSGVWVRFSSTKAWAKVHELSAQQIAVGDINGDGWPDLLGSWNSLGVLVMDMKRRTWEMATTSLATILAVLDYNNDGKDDLIGVWGEKTGVWVLYSGSGEWENIAADPARDLARGDMNGDGHPDLVGTWDGSGTYYVDSVTKEWTQLGAPASQVICGDLDGDGTDDLIVVWPSQTGVWVLNSSDINATWLLLLAVTPRDMATGKMRAPLLGEQISIQPTDIIIGLDEQTRDGLGFGETRNSDFNPPGGQKERQKRNPGPGDSNFRFVIRNR